MVLVARKMEWKDLVKSGIIDPVEVPRSALENAVSVAGLFFTTECSITELPEKKKAPPMPD